MKKYSVNVHYETVITVANIFAKNEEEACEKASEIAASMSLNDADVVAENQCVTRTDDIQIPATLREKPMFEYKGKHFIPAGTFSSRGLKADFFFLSKLISSEMENGLNRKNRNWNKEEFEQAENPSNDEKAWSDLFFCIETGKTYTPGQNELFIIEHPNLKF